MPPFQYSSGIDPRVSGSLADLMLRRGDIRAKQALDVANANARAAEVGGQAWAGAAQNIGQTIAAIPQQIQQQKEQALRGQLLQGQVQDRNDLRSGQKAMDSLLAGDQLPPDQYGPRKESYLRPDGLYDIQKLSSGLAASGVGHLAPDLLKHAEDLNASIATAQQHDQQAAQSKTIMLGFMANGALKLHQSVGMPLDGAIDFIAQPGLATQQIKPQELAAFKQQIAQLPPDQQVAALQQIKAHAAEVAPTKEHAKDSTTTNIFGEQISSNIVPEKDTEASLAMKAAKGDPQARIAMGLLKPGPKRTESEAALDAFAKSLGNGKTKAEDLTDAERQMFVKRDAETKAKTAFAQHVNERNYDVSHPVPVKGKSQDELEQEARGVLQREFSSRSGGLGVEDAKVNQAVHLVALLDQFEGKPMPAQIHAELAMGLAKLTSSTGNVGIEMEKEFKQKTAAEGLSKGIAFLTGDPTLVNATPDQLRAMLRDSITRQGQVAEQNRQTYLDAMLKMLPTQLEQSRREALSKSVQLNKLPTPKGAAPKITPGLQGVLERK